MGELLGGINGMNKKILGILVGLIIISTGGLCGCATPGEIIEGIHIKKYI